MIKSTYMWLVGGHIVMLRVLKQIEKSNRLKAANNRHKKITNLFSQILDIINVTIAINYE